MSRGRELYSSNKYALGIWKHCSRGRKGEQRSLVSCVLTTPPFDESLPGQICSAGGWGVPFVVWCFPDFLACTPVLWQHHHSSWVLGSDLHRTLSICRSWWEAVSLDRCFGVTPIPPQFCSPHRRWLGLLWVIAQHHGSRRTKLTSKMICCKLF